MLRIASLTLGALLLAGCSAFPDSIATDNEDALVSYSQVKNNASTTVGQSARWGGIIADVRNDEGFTVIELVHFPLKSWGRPLVSDDTDGRFLAVINGFVDPQVYRQGRSLTVLGKVGKTQEGKIDDYTYVYPVIEATGYHLWPKEADRVDTGINYSPLWFRHNFYAPYPYRPYYYPYPTRVRVQDDKPSTKNKQ